MKTDAGYDIQAQQMGGGPDGDYGAGGGGQPTYAATTLTDTGKTWTSNAFIGKIVVVGNAYANIVSNTTTALTVDKWRLPGSDTATTTPSTNAAYTILPGGGPAWYMGLTADTGTVVSGDTTLPSEITTSGGGLIRKRCVYAHTASASTYTLTGTFTANGSDSLPVTVAKMGIAPREKGSSASPTCLFQTLFPSTSTLSTIGDQLTVTDTVSM